MKVSTALLLIAGAVLGWIAYSSEGRSEAAETAALAMDDPVPVQLSGEVPAGYVTRVFDVDGMCCNGCPRGLYEKVLGVDGVAEAAASFDEGTVSAVVPEELPVEALTAVLQSAKYTPTLRAD